MTEEATRPEDTCLIGFMRGMLEGEDDEPAIDEARFQLLFAALQSVGAIIDSGQTPAGVLMNQADFDALTDLVGPGPYSMAGRDLVFQVADVPAPTAYAQAG